MAQRLATIAARPAVSGISAPVYKSRRREERRPVYRHGRILLPGGGAADCMIVDVSENGARIQLDGAMSLPEMVTLKVVATGAAHRSRVVWRKENAAGLAFAVEPTRTFGCRGPG
jgi:hypothetical protein